MQKSSEKEQYSEREGQQRFEAALKGDTPHKVSGFPSN